MMHLSMAKRTIDLLQTDEIKNLPGLRESEIASVRFFRNRNLVEVTLNTEDLLSCEEYEYIRNYFQSFTGSKTELYIKPKTISFNQMLIEEYIRLFSSENKDFQVFEDGFVQLDESGCIQLLFEKIQETEAAAASLPLLTKTLEKIGITDFTYRALTRERKEIEIPEMKMPSLPIPEKNVEEAPVKKNKTTNYPKRRSNFEPITLNQAQEYYLRSPNARIEFVGKIFATEISTTKDERSILSLKIYDENDAIYAKCFENESFTPEFFETIKEGQMKKFRGVLREDDRLKDLVVLVNEIEDYEETFEVDTAPEKRIEFHMHTNMSEMDGVCSASEVVEYAYRIGHEGIVITDHADVQSFVKAYNTGQSLKKKGDRPFKVGLGCEVNVVEDQLKIVYNETKEPLEHQTYISFDLETTGLSCYFDHIIEFGAVRIRDGIIVDRKQLFIKPPVTIPSFIVNKTNITNEMVKDAKPFAEAVDEILDYLGDAILVAHNASFDYHFLNEELRRIGRPPIQNTVIDTLDLSRAILKERRVYRLGSIARNYRISYDDEVAHRADYDAEVLSSVFLSLLKDATNLGAKTIFDLQYRIQGEDAFKKVRRSHTILIAKNQEGIRSLYRLITDSHTNHLLVLGKSSKKEDAEVSSEARVLRSLVNQYRKDFLVGSSCQNNELFELACNGDDARLEEAMKWYDYVELQPLDCYSTYVVLGNVPNQQRIKEAQLRLIQMAKKLHIPVIADSDAHYCKPSQKIFRDVYITNQGIGGVVHPLFIRDEALRLRTSNPSQHLRFTQEMLQDFAWLEDDELIHEIVLDNPKALFQQIDEVQPVPSGVFPPVIDGSDDKLREICNGTAMRLYGYEGVVPEIVQNRLNQELDNIIRHGYGVHYYIAHLLVKKSNEDGYTVGSRGSVGSSFTATMSGITEVNPLPPHYLCPHCKHSEWIEDINVKSGYDLEDKECPICGQRMKGNGQNIPFQTFLGFDADKTPDIDLNFSNEYQAKAHAFIRDIFGEKHAYRAGTIGTVAERTAYGYVLGYCERMKITNMRNAMRDYLASGCQNVKRTTGQHPGGIIIIPKDHEAEDFTPIQFPANDPDADWRTTHYDFHDIHDNVLKFDILGHVDPTAMRLLTNISKMNPLDIPMNDPKVLSVFYSDQALKADPKKYHKETGALGLPEFGTSNTRKTLEQTRPHRFSDLVILSGLSHGEGVWEGNAKSLVQNGHSLQEVIGCRDDIMTYLLDHKLEPLEAFTIMEKVRKGKGLSEQQETIMREHNVPEWYIDSCKKIKYMFPKAHAVAYVMMAIRIAWYKIYEPQNFYIQFLTLRSDAYEIETMVKGFEAIQSRMRELEAKIKIRFGPEAATNKEKAIYATLEICEELYARGYQIANIDLKRSQATQFVVDENNDHILIPPFAVIDGLGANVARSIAEARDEQMFISKEDLMKRTACSTTIMKKLEVLGCLQDLQERNQLSLF